MNDLEKWRDARFKPDLHVYMVDPHNLDIVRGELIGLKKNNITDGYFSDTKVSGSIETIDDNYIDGSWLRVVADGEEVATLGVQNRKSTQAPEGWQASAYDMQSTLWMLDSDIAYHLYTIGQNTRANNAVRAIAKTCGKEVIFQAGCRDAIYTTAKAYERTDSYRSILADICSKANNQLSVDGHGRLSVAPYIDPASKTVSWTLNADDSRGVVLSPGYEDSDASGEAYNRSVVVATNDNRTIIASTDAPASSPISSAYRGWTRTNVHDLSDMSPFTQARAQQLANQYAVDDRSQGKTRDCTCMYFPVKAGEVVDWVQDGNHQRHLVQTVESDLIAWTVKLTLKKI